MQIKMLLQLNTKILCQQIKKNTIKKNKEKLREKARIKRLNMSEEEKQKLREK